MSVDFMLLNFVLLVITATIYFLIGYDLKRMSKEVISSRAQIFTDKLGSIFQIYAAVRIAATLFDTMILSLPVLVCSYVVTIIFLIAVMTSIRKNVTKLKQPTGKDAMIATLSDILAEMKDYRDKIKTEILNWNKCYDFLFSPTNAD